MSTPTAHHSTRRAAAFVFAGIALGVAGLATSVAAEDGDHKVTLCHATRSTTNPYVQVTVDYHSIITRGHGSHDGPVFTGAKNPAWGDVIPAFDFGPDARFDGLNLTEEGQALLDGGCTAGGSTTTSSSSTTWPLPQ